MPAPRFIECYKFTLNSLVCAYLKVAAIFQVIKKTAIIRNPITHCAKSYTAFAGNLIAQIYNFIYEVHTRHYRGISL